MDLKLFDKVFISDKDVVGTIVDIYTDIDNDIVYTVQSSKRGYVNDPDAYPGEFPLYHCSPPRLKKI